MLFLYELSGAIFLYLPTSGISLIAVTSSLEEDLIYYPLSIALLQCLIYTSFIYVRRRSETPHALVEDQQVVKRFFFTVTFFVCFCCLVAYLTNAGSERLKDYIGEEAKVSPFYSYGTTLLTVMFIHLSSLYEKKKYLLIAAIFIAIYPLMYELFISSRRQFFAPIIGLILFSIVYRKRDKVSWMRVIILLMASLTLLGFQFLSRNIFTGNISESLSIFDATLAPQLSEFVGIGNTSLLAWEKYVVLMENISFGLQFAFYLINAIPYIKIGTFLFPDYMNVLSSSFLEIAPFGGLSVIAEAFFSFGIFGILPLGVLLGFLLAKADLVMSSRLQDGMPRDIGSIFKISLTCILLFKYRSGLSDALSFSVLYSMLFWSLFFVSTISVSHRRKRFSYTSE